MTEYKDPGHPNGSLRKTRALPEGSAARPKLSKRLGVISSFVKNTPFAVDVGTDHGYIPITLVMDEICTYAAACDVRTGPLERAKEHIRACGLTEKIDVFLSDGLQNEEIYAAIRKRFPFGERGTLIIAGMGGILMRSILDAALNASVSNPDALNLKSMFETMILQPQSDMELVRSWLAEHDYKISAEEMLIDAGKYYTVMRCEDGTMKLSEAEALYGPELIRSRNPVLLEYLGKRKEEKEEILEKLSEDPERYQGRITEIEYELNLILESVRRMR